LKLTGTLIALGTIVLLFGCGPAEQNSTQSSLPGSTGYFDTDGIDYLHNGDPYVIKRMAEERKPPQDQQNPPPPSSNPGTPPSATPSTSAPTLRDRITNFGLSRFNDGEKNADRFGRSTFELTVYFKEKTSVTFKGRLIDQGDRLHFDASTGDYRVQGNFIDDVTHEKTTTDGFYLINTKTSEKVEISYIGSKILITVYPENGQTIKPGSLFECQLKALQDSQHFYKWGNNWVILGGRSFYFYDFVKHVKEGDTSLDCLPNDFSISGESKRVSLDDKTITHPARSSSDVISNAELTGNSDVSNQRALEVTLKDKNTNETLKTLIVTDPANPEDRGPSLSPDEMPIEYGPPSDPGEDGDDTTTTPTPTPRPSPSPSTPSTSPVSVPAGSKSFAFLREDSSQSYTARMVRDYRRNRQVPGVLRFMRQLQNAPKSMQNFIDYGYPFRAVMDAISKAYDVSSMYAYISYNQNASYKGGHYAAPEGDNSTPGHAVGPFQMHIAAAKDGGLSGLSVSRGANDERHYFVTSACGAAQYLHLTTKGFLRGDTTFGILGYNQGVAGTIGAIKKAEHTAQAFSVSYATLAGHGGLPSALRDYVDQALAVYFILSDMPRYGFSISPKAKLTLPDNGTVIPPKGISNSKCEAAVTQVLSIGT
jgi:hypothetical protein